jgi:hypothetical protein
MCIPLLPTLRSRSRNTQLGIIRRFGSSRIASTSGTICVVIRRIEVECVLCGIVLPSWGRGISRGIGGMSAVERESGWAGVARHGEVGGSGVHGIDIVGCHPW